MKPIAIFYRGDHFYPIEMMEPELCGKTLTEQAADHAELNPGTTCVRDVEGNVLWSLQ